jgi:hypothetical protein
MVPQSEESAAGHEKDDDEWTGREAKESEQACEARLRHHAVWAIKTQSPLRLVGSQPGRSCLQLLKQALQRPIPSSEDVSRLSMHAVPVLRASVKTGHASTFPMGESALKEPAAYSCGDGCQDPAILTMESEPIALMATLTASSIGSLKGTSIRSRPCS